MPALSSMLKIMAPLLALIAFIISFACTSPQQQTPASVPPKNNNCNSLKLVQDDDDEDEEDEEDEEDDEDEEDEDEEEEAVTYEDDIEDFLEENCTSCHSEDGSGDEPYLDTYTLAKKVKSKIASQVANEDMPVGGGLSSAERKLVADWKAAGYPETQDDVVSENEDEDEEDDEDEDDDTGLDDEEDEEDCESTGSQSRR